MNEPMRASIIIVNYNGGELLQRCVQAAVSGLPPTNTDEILLVDNVSTDGSADAVEANFPTVQVIRSTENLGFAGGNNLAVQYAKGEYLAFLNPDAVAEPAWHDQLIAALETTPQAGMATSKIVLLEKPDTINTCGGEMHITGLTLCRGMGAPHNTYTQQDEVSAISGAAFAMRRDLYLELGGFDESFFLYIEDTDLSLRVRLAGYRCIYVPTSLVYHNYELRFGPKKTLYQERNRYRMLLKSLHWQTILALLPALLLAEIVTWGFVVLRDRKRFMNKLHAYVSIAQHWPTIMQQRADVQATRRVSDHELLALCTYRIAYEQTGESFSARMAQALFDPVFFLLKSSYQESARIAHTRCR